MVECQVKNLGTLQSLSQVQIDILDTPSVKRRFGDDEVICSCVVNHANSDIEKRKSDRTDVKGEVHDGLCCYQSITD